MRRTAGFVIAMSLSVAVIAQTPTGQTAEPLRLISLSHFIHATEHLETTLAFYKAVFDFDAAPPRVNSNPGVALLNNKPGIGLRASTPKFPGETFGIEMTDFSNVDKKGGQARATDPGGIQLILPVRDLDAVVAAAKRAGAPIVTRSGAPITIETPTGKSRAIVLRDNDGFMVRAVEVPATMPGMVQPGASMAVAVTDINETAKFYHDVVGVDLTGDAKWTRDAAMADLVGAPAKSQYRMMSFAFPGTKSARMEFYEWKGMPRTPFHLRVPDPGASGWVARVSNIDAMMTQVNARHTPKLTPEPVWFTKTISDIFITDPNGMNLELFQNVPAPKPTN
ncbi:MAG TPA: VOC family protein [Vicinamibacterales bacterium]|nr:VOC family protein [Vicinamibacterales bacterium]